MASDLYMSPRQRVTTSVLGAGAGMVAIPLLMRTWAPNWAVMVWLLVYVVITVTAWAMLLRTEKNIEQWWTSSVGFLFGLLPISATWWDQGTKSYWIAAVIVTVSIATEVSTLPYIKIHEWRIGVLGSGAMLVGAGLFEVGYVALAMVPVLFAIISSADRMRLTKVALEDARSQADAKTARAERLANRDELTGLLNRRGIASEMERLADLPHTMLMVDADRFKAINDGHGYAAGDQVIQQIARVLRDRLGDGWLVGRHGGDEFLAIADGYPALPSTVCDPVTCQVHLYGTTSQLKVGLSGGFMVADGNESSDRVVSKVSYAMRAAKRKGAAIMVFDGLLSDQYDRMLEVSAPTGDQIRSASLTAEFQVVIDDQSRIVGCEALARWKRPDGSLVPPVDFLPVLADNGQMPLLNEVMLTHGIEFASRFPDGPNAPFVAVNIGSASLASTDLVTLVSSLLHQYKVSPHRLMIEITESEGLGQHASWEAAAQALNTLGVRLAIDDFGSGYSNIERLSQLPISFLKFDRSLTGAVAGPLGPIVRGVVEFAGRSGIGIIGEGIESDSELAAIRRLGVGLYQGFHLGRPASPEIVEQMIRTSQHHATQRVEIADLRPSVL